MICLSFPLVLCSTAQRLSSYEFSFLALASSPSTPESALISVPMSLRLNIIIMKLENLKAINVLWIRNLPNYVVKDTEILIAIL